jgi:hypothetical protein
VANQAATSFIRAGSTLAASATAAYSPIASIVAGSLLQVPVFVERGTLLGAGTLHGNPGLRHITTGRLVGAGSLLEPIAANASLVAGSTITASCSVHYRATAHPTGGSLLLPPHTTAAALSTGSSLTATAVVSRNAQAHLFVSSSLAAPTLFQPRWGPIQRLLLGGQAVGAGTLSDQLLRLGAGTVVGAGGLHGTPIVRRGAVLLRMVGRGGMHDSIPLPMVGQGNVVGFFQVVQVPYPLCGPRPWGWPRRERGDDPYWRGGDRDKHRECSRCLYWHTHHCAGLYPWWRCPRCLDRHISHLCNHDHDDD